MSTTKLHERIYAPYGPPRCLRWYPRIQRATPDGHGRRRFDYLGGYPPKAAARSALNQALGRHGDHLAPTVQGNQAAALVGGHSRPSTTCWTTGSPTCKPTRPSGCEPSTATANC
jgi:hypothetical protein